MHPAGRIALLLAAALIVAALLGSGARALLAVGVPALAIGLGAPALPRGPRAAVLLLSAVLAIGAGIIARSVPVGLAGVVCLALGARDAWGVHRGRPRRRAWAWRAATAVGAVVALYLLVYPTLLTVGYVAAPDDPVRGPALGGIRSEEVAFPASDGVRLSGTWAPGRGDAAVALVHGGGGTRDGTARHARMLADAGYGVLLYDARGRGRSAGKANAFGWAWHRDVRGAVDFLRSHGIRRIGLLGLSTGAEAVVTEAAGDPRVGAVVADGLQGRTATDASVLGTESRLSLQPVFAVMGWELRLTRGEDPPPPLRGAVRSVAATRPLLLVGTDDFEREFQRAYARGTRAEVWEMPCTRHTQGLRDEPARYRERVLAVLRRGLG